MAGLRIEARDVLDEARDAIAFIAVWKNGRSWRCMAFYPDVVDDNPTLAFEDFERNQLENIVKIDPQAILVNGYYDNLGDCDCMTRDSLADALRWQYENGHNLIADTLATCAK